MKWNWSLICRFCSKKENYLWKTKNTAKMVNEKFMKRDKNEIIMEISEMAQFCIELPL